MNEAKDDHCVYSRNELVLGDKRDVEARISRRSVRQVAAFVGRSLKLPTHRHYTDSLMGSRPHEPNDAGGRGSNAFIISPDSHSPTARSCLFPLRLSSLSYLSYRPQFARF